MKLATIITHRNRPDLADKQYERVKELTENALVYHPETYNDLMIVDCGGDKHTENPYYWYSDPEFQGGKIRGHMVGLQLLGLDYDYVWLNHPDLIFEDDDTLSKLISTMERNIGIGLISPLFNGYYTGKDTVGEFQGWHPVGCVDYLSFFIRGEALRMVGLLDEGFNYSVGADLDYGYRMWSRGWIVAFCDRVSMHHLGGTTYGAPGTDTISRQQYKVNSGIQAFKRLKEKYGEHWGEYMGRLIPEGIPSQIDFCWRNRRNIKT